MNQTPTEESLLFSESQDKNTIASPWKQYLNQMPPPVSVLAPDQSLTKAATSSHGFASSESRSKEGIQFALPLTTAKHPTGSSLELEKSATFTEKRSGEAEDSDLLALLREVSLKSSCSSRFDDQPATSTYDDDVPQVKEIQNTNTVRPTSTKQIKTRSLKNPATDSVALHKQFQVETLMTKDPEPSLTHACTGDDSNIAPQEERKGVAEKAELIALLQGISSKSSSARRFEEETNIPEPESAFFATCQAKFRSRIDMPPFETPAYVCESSQFPNLETERLDSYEDSGLLESIHDVASKSNPMRISDKSFDMLSVSFVPASSDVNIVITRENVLASFHDKNWKTRVAAFEFLSNSLLSIVSTQTELWNVDSNQLVEGLDEILPKLLEDSNAGALDKALDFVLLYAEHCKSAGTAEQAAKLVKALIGKNAFSSTRPTTLKMANCLVLKLMEVNTSGNFSIHAIINVLLAEGLISKKPKVVQASVSLIQNATCEFGASNLPLSSIIASSTKMLAHSNPSIRNSTLHILADICRSLGSTAHIQDVIDKMKKSQVVELATLIRQDPATSSICRECRWTRSSSSNTCSTSAAVGTLNEGVKQLAAQRFASRTAVNLIAMLSKTDYARQIGLVKWSEKVAALQIVLECGGEKPFKLLPQSSSSNYAPLIIEMKKLLGHTHFAVCSKSLEVLSMLAQGVGDSLFSYLRPLLVVLVKLSKDKKLTTSVNSCLDSLFGKVLGFDHLLDADDGLPLVLDENKEKNSLVRATAMDFLVRSVEQNSSSGPRGMLSKESASNITSLCLVKLDDSNGSVRKTAMNLLKALCNSDIKEVKQVTTKLVDLQKEKNPRKYKSLTCIFPKTELIEDPLNENLPVEVQDRTIPLCKESALLVADRERRHPVVASKISGVTKTVSVAQEPHLPVDGADYQSVTLERALAHASSLQITKWDAPEDDGGILTGLACSKWILRQDAIKSIRSFIESDSCKLSVDLDLHTTSLLTIVGEYTRSFKESNVNVMKSIMMLFLSVCQAHETAQKPVNKWIASSGTNAAVSKISDKKLSDSCKSILTSMCVVHSPLFILLHGFDRLKLVTSPVAHEEYLKWIGTFCLSFGAASIGSGVSLVYPYLLEELESSAVKVRREALLIIGTFYMHIGLPFKALALSTSKLARGELDKCFEQYTLDPKIQDFHWPKRSLYDSKDAEKSGHAGIGVSMEVPRSDLFASVGIDCIQRLYTKEGKTSWKIRKEAMDEVESALQNCAGLVDTTGPRIKHILDLSKALRDRLSDTQINLKPIAARIIAALLSNVDKSSQTKIGRTVFASLINASMFDIKKTMRDAALSALKCGIITSELVGAGFNKEAMESFVMALAAEVNESTAKAVGLPELLDVLGTFVKSLPRFNEGISSSGSCLGEKYADLLVECVTSSRVETRTSASSLFDISFEKNILNIAAVRKVTERLKPSKQQTVGVIIAKYAGAVSIADQTGKENCVSISMPTPSCTSIKTGINSCEVNTGLNIDHDVEEGSALDLANSKSVVISDALRARLLKIKGTGKGTTEASASREPTDRAPKYPSGMELYQEGMKHLKIVQSKGVPIGDDDINLLALICSLNHFHSAIAKQQSTSTNLCDSQLEDLRFQLSLNLQETLTNVSLMISFGFEIGPRDVNAGMSIPLLSVCLATLMAIFRDEKLTAMVEKQVLCSSIRELGTALLDSRLNAESEVDEGTSSQLIRAINKLIVQAVTATPRNVSLQALLSLHHQLFREAAMGLSEDDSIINSRLSRVVSKAFTRVVKAEEVLAKPFSRETIDIVELVTAIDVVLVDVADSESYGTDLARTLTKAIVKIHGSSALVSVVKKLGMDIQTSKFIALVFQCAHPLEGTTTLHLATPSIESIKTNEVVIGGDIADATCGVPCNASYRTSRCTPFQSDRGMEANTMTARLKSLRSRLEATERAVMMTVDRKPIPIAATIDAMQEDLAGESRRSQLSPQRVSRLSQPTPLSKLLSPVSSSLALRERLAAAQNCRKQSIPQLEANLLQSSDQQNDPVITASLAAMQQRSATLRARLEAVKYKKKVVTVSTAVP